MRVTTAFNKMLAIPGATIASVEFTPAGVVAGLRPRFRRLTCPACGWSTRARYDVRERRWRHLDLGGCKLWLQADIRRLECRRCDKTVTEAVPWARPSAWHTRDLQDVACWLAQRTDKTTVCRLLRISWEAVRNAVIAVVDDYLDDTRLDGLYRIGVDEVSYRKGHQYLTIVADHDRNGAVVWAGEGKNADALSAFYDQLGPQRAAQLQAVSRDLGYAYEKATTAYAPQAAQCIDPFHVVQLANAAVDKVRRFAWRTEQHRHPRPKRGRGRPPKGSPPTPPRPSWVKRTRWALLKDPDTLNANQLQVLHQLRQQRSALYRAWQLKEGLRDLYRLDDPADAPAHLDWWLAWACRSRLPAFLTLSRTIRANRDRILAAVDLGLSNSKLEGLASKIRLINHRGYGHHSAAAVIAMIYLCCSGLTIQLPLT